MDSSTTTFEDTDSQQLFKLNESVFDALYQSNYEMVATASVAFGPDFDIRGIQIEDYPVIVCERRPGGVIVERVSDSLVGEDTIEKAIADRVNAVRWPDETDDPIEIEVHTNGFDELLIDELESRWSREFKITNSASDVQ